MVHSITIDIYKKIYKNAFFIREVEKRIALEYPKQEIRCPTHLSIGQELVSSIINLLISKKDYAVSTHRAHAHYLAKGGDLNAFIAELYGKRTGCSKGIGGSMHLIDTSVNFMGSSAIVGNSIPIGVGLAQAAKLKKNNAICLVFLGDGATEEGVFYESVNYAVTKKQPVLFICENNFYSVYSDLKPRQPSTRKIYKMAGGLGLKTFYVKNHKIDQYYQALLKSFEYVRKYQSPAFIELETYRYLEHCGYLDDDHLMYRDDSEIKKWKKLDCILMLERLIVDFKKDTEIQRFKKRTLAKIEKAFIFAKKSKPLSYEVLEQLKYAK